MFFYIDLNWAYCFLQLYPISIRPSGKMLGALLDFIIIDRPKDTGPTLPMNMVRHRMIRDRGSSLPVTPALRPAVPKAEAASYKRSMNRICGFKSVKAGVRKHHAKPQENHG